MEINFIQRIIKTFVVCTIKFKNMSLNVGMELLYMRRKRTFIFVLNVKSNAVLKTLQQYGCPENCTCK